MPSTALVVDSDRLIRQVLGDLLREAGFQVFHAVAGREGISVALAHLPDILLLDIALPDMDGVQTCRKLRSLPQFRHTPILMMTSRTSRERINPFQVGADDYLIKPFDGYELVTRVQANLVKKRALTVMEEKACHSDALQEITGLVNSPADTAEILRQMVAKIARILGDVNRCYITLIQEEEKCGYVLASSDSPRLSRLRIDLDNYPEIREVMRTGRPILIEDVRKDPLMASVRPLLRENFTSILVLPVFSGQRVVGAMAVRTHRSEAISAEQIEFCQLVANVSMSAFTNASYFESVRGESEVLKEAKKRLEEELHVKAIYEQLFENASEGLAAFNERGEVVFINCKALEIIGFSRQELAGLTFASILDLRSIRQILRVLRLKRRGQPTSEFDISVRTKSGLRRTLSVSLNRKAVCGELHLISFRDVTEKRFFDRELRKTKRELEKANRQLKELDRFRSEFLKTATHELRTPVTIVNGYCSLLQEMGVENLTSQQREFLDAAIENSDRLVDMMNNMLDLSRFEAGKMEMAVQPRDLRTLLERIQGDVQPLVAGEGLMVEIQPVLNPCIALFDEEKIHRVLLNLVGNAIKFTPRGGRIRLAVDEREEIIQVSVEDTGHGIPSERLSDIFEEFVQLDPSHRGTGLGLSICKKIIASHHGTIWAESTIGQGSRFFFTLPKPSSVACLK